MDCLDWLLRFRKRSGGVFFGFPKGWEISLAERFSEYQEGICSNSFVVKYSEETRIQKDKQGKRNETV
jgi:hypothetical protein